MAHTISANGLTISHKGTGGFEMNSTPDVCRVGGTPVPFQIISFSRDLIRGSVTVLADGGNTIDFRGSAHETCYGDEPGAGLGVISQTHRNESTWITWSPDVRVEGRNVARLSDKMFMNNRNCTSGDGGHYEVPAAITDPVMRELCKIFCASRDEWHACKKKGGKCPRPSSIAEGKVKNMLGQANSALNNAVKKVVPNGIGRAEWTYFASSDKIFDGARKIYDRSGLERAVKRQIDKLIKNKIIQKGTKMAARAWTKLVPGLNILSTIYDVVDTAVTAYDIYDQIANSSKIADNAIKVKPDFSIQGEDGALEKVYDFKFDDPDTGYTDDWQAGQQQEEAYRRAAGKSPEKVDNATCQCDKTGGPKPPRIG